MFKTISRSVHFSIANASSIISAVVLTLIHLSSISKHIEAGHWSLNVHWRRISVDLTSDLFIFQLLLFCLSRVVFPCCWRFPTSMKICSYINGIWSYITKMAVMHADMYHEHHLYKREDRCLVTFLARGQFPHSRLLAYDHVVPINMYGNCLAF